MEKIKNINLTVQEDKENKTTSLNFRYSFEDENGNDHFLMRSYPICTEKELDFLEKLNTVISDFILDKQ